MSTRSKPTTPRRTPQASDDCILVLQGGGALGAYQAGVFEALCQADRTPSWIAGISIGAINAALIAGNPAHLRIQRLREFWERVSSSVASLPARADLKALREPVNDASALQAMLFGVAGFFTPRLPPAWLYPAGSMEAISYYSTEPLRQTLERLVDFDLLNAGNNAGTPRLSVGAVNVGTGNFEYFDSAQRRIDVRHIMASGALPPGFAPVDIDGQCYWDGGLVSNTPLQYVLDLPSNCRRQVVFQVDLFPARGAIPRTLAEVTEREKDIRFSSRTRLNTSHQLERQAVAQSVQRLLAKLPPALRTDPDVLALSGLRQECEIDVVHLIYRSRRYESYAKDYEFSRRSMLDHWNAGHTDMVRTLHDPRWLQHQPSSGVHVFDLTS